MSALATTLVDLLRESQQHVPDNEAIVHAGTRTSYRELWERVVRGANALQALGLPPGERVALLLDNSVNYVVAYYATLKAGGVAVGLNTAQRGPELQRSVAHCGATIVISAPGQPGLADVAKAEGVRHVLTTWTDIVAQGDAADRGPGLAGNQPASIIYTSGTTGDPRGVTLSHRNLVANTRSILEYLELSDRDRIVNVLPFYYSYGNSVLHTHLAVGGTLVLENSLTYPLIVMQSMVNERATGFSGVPSTFALLLQRVKIQDFDLSTMRYLTQAGGAMAPAMVQRVREALPHARLFVMYGMTEATARISYLPPDRLQDKLGSVGIAIPGVAVEVRDEQGMCVAPGVVGQVWVRGENVMLGYWNNADATARVLRDGWLHTGDLGSADEDGYLTLVGRSSDMIKTGAHRVSPLEIEEVVMELDAVAECAAVGVADDILGEVIRLCIVPVQGKPIEPRAVQAHCRSRLALYKVPKEVTFVAQLPRTASGKIKRFQLKDAGPHT